MSETTQIVKTIYDSSAPEVQVLLDTLYSKYGASDYDAIMRKKALRVRPKERAKAKTIRSDLNEIWKDCREDGTAPNTDKVQEMWSNLQKLNKEIRKGVLKKKLHAEARSVYREAVELYVEYERELMEAIRGLPVEATKKLNPAILARIEIRRKENA